MCQVGHEIRHEAEKAKSTTNINSTIKNTVVTIIPTGDELATALTKQEMTLDELLAKMENPPDIKLEKEMIWPNEPDLVY